VSPQLRLVALALLWLMWVLPFLLHTRTRRSVKAQVDPRARWGIVLEGIGFAMVYLHRPATWATSLPVWRAAVGLAFAAPSIFLARNAVRHLGRQWRFDAGLNRDHDLVQTGPYRIVRHPIYAAILLMFCAVVAWLGTLPGWPVGLVLVVAGTEIRVRIEDGLLKRQFGDRFVAWQRAVPAYLPFVR